MLTPASVRLDILAEAFRSARRAIRLAAAGETYVAIQDYGAARQSVGFALGRLPGTSGGSQARIWRSMDRVARRMARELDYARGAGGPARR